MGHVVGLRFTNRFFCIYDMVQWFDLLTSTEGKTKRNLEDPVGGWYSGLSEK